MCACMYVCVCMHAHGQPCVRVPKPLYGSQGQFQVSLTMWVHEIEFRSSCLRESGPSHWPKAANFKRKQSSQACFRFLFWNIHGRTYYTILKKKNWVVASSLQSKYDLHSDKTNESCMRIEDVFQTCLVWKDYWGLLSSQTKSELVQRAQEWESA